MSLRPEQDSTYVRTASEAATQLFCRAEATLQRDKGALGQVYRDDSYYARMPNCGHATAVVQHELQTHDQLSFDRVYGEPADAPRTRFSHRRFGHVILANERYLVDPTYGQLFLWAGVDPRDDATMPNHYPEATALVVERDQPETALEPLAESLYRAAHSEHTQAAAYAPLRELGRRAVTQLVNAIYDPERYATYDTAVTDPAYEYRSRLMAVAESFKKSETGHS